MARISKLRLLVFLAALIVLGCRFALAPVPDPAQPGLSPDLAQLVQTAAGGYPLQIRPGVTVNKIAHDVGMFFYPSLAITLFPPAARPGLALWQWLQLGFIVAGCAVMLMPGVPLRLGGAGVAALVTAVVLSGDCQLASMFGFHFYGYWAPPLAALVTLVWMLGLPRMPRRVTLATALLVGALGEWRADAGVIPCFAALALAGVTAARALAARVRERDAGSEAGVTQRGMRIALFCLAFVLASRIPDLAVRAILFAHQTRSGVQHFTAGRAKGHMLWHNMYLSYSADTLNPHGVAWDDHVGWLHAAEHDPALASLPGNGAFTEAHDRTLRNLYVLTAFRDPALWLRAAAARTGMVCDDIGWGWLYLALAALMVSSCLAASASGRVALPLPWGRIALDFDAATSVTGWGHGPLCCAIVAGAAILPPLLYNGSPWYARAATLIVRATPLLLLGGLAARAARRTLVPCPTPVVDRLVTRAAVRVSAALSGALALFLASGFAVRVLSGQPVIAPGAPPATVADLARRFDADPRTLRVELASARSADVSRIVDQLLSVHGPVKGGGRILQFPAESEHGSVRAVAWVRNHLLVAFKCARAWPYNGLMRDRGGVLLLEFQGSSFYRYDVPVPAMLPGEEVLWMMPLSPNQADPLAVTMSLRETGLAPHQTGANLGQILELKRTPSW